MNPTLNKTYFHNRISNYFLIVIFGVIAGLLVAFFSRFSYQGIWSFSSFSSTTIGFWMFTTSLIVLFSEKRYVAAINAELYVFFLFLITNISKSIRLIELGYAETLKIDFLYALIPALVCSLLALFLFNARKGNLLSRLILYLPLITIVIECMLMLYLVLTKQRMLFQFLLDACCALIYIIIFNKQLLINSKQKNIN